MKKIAIIGTVGLPANYGGFETLTKNIVEHLRLKFRVNTNDLSQSY